MNKAAAGAQPESQKAGKQEKPTAREKTTPKAAIPLAKLTKGELADQWGPLKVKAKAIDEQIEALKEEFDRRGLSVVTGANFSVVKSSRSFDGLDIKGIRAEMGAAWCKAHGQTVTRTTYEVAPIGGEKKPLANKAAAK